MASDVASIGLTFDGEDIQNLDGLFLEITYGLAESPDTRGIDVVVPGADGEVPRPRRFDKRKILLTGFVRGDGVTQELSRASYRGAVTAMIGLFQTGGGASYEPRDLVAALEDGTIATVPCRTTSIETAEIIQSEYTNVSIELLAVEDWSYETPGS